MDVTDVGQALLPPLVRKSPDAGGFLRVCVQVGLLGWHLTNSACGNLGRRVSFPGEPELQCGGSRGLS